MKINESIDPALFNTLQVFHTSSLEFEWQQFLLGP